MIALLAISCSGKSSSPTLPNSDRPGLTSGLHDSSSPKPESKMLWGMWKIILNTETMEASIVPQRGIEYTVDVVTFLQKPMGNPANLQIKITDLTDWLTKGIMTVEVGLRHPFPGLNQYVGFDVLGVFIGSGNKISSYDPGVVYSDGNIDPILLNADGYTRWMNPSEFVPDGTILRFVPGKLGNQNLSLMTATINGYKYFTDGLGLKEDLYGFFQSPSNIQARGQFKPGSLNWREYLIKFPMPAGAPVIEFQYAVIASWVEPDKAASGDPFVIDIPDDYPPSANASESFLCKITDKSTLWYVGGEKGGDLILDLEIFDWAGYFNPGSIPGEISAITIESNSGLFPNPVSFSGASLAPAPGSTAASSVFTIEIEDCTPSGLLNQELIITIEQANGAFAPNPDLSPVIGAQLASYVRHTAKVSNTKPTEEFVVTNPNGGETLWMALYHEIKWNPSTLGITNISIEWSTDDFTSDIQLIIPNTENDGSFIWKPIPCINTTSGKIRIKDVASSMSDTSDNYFSIKAPVWLEFQPEVPITNTSVTWNYYSGSVDYSQAFDEFSPALSQDHDGLVHVCWSSERAFVEQNNRQARDLGIRSMEGHNWNGEGGFFFTWGSLADPLPQYECRGDYLKLAPAANNTTYAAVWHWRIYFSVDVDHFPNAHYEYNYPCLVNRIYKNCEIMTDNTYLYMVSDGMSSFGDGPGVYSVRVPTPNWTWSGPGPTVNIADTGEVSHSRSWVTYNGKLALIYYTLDGRIMLSKQTDAVNDTWDPNEVVFNGAGYLDCANPSIWVDGNGRLFAVWTGQHQATSEYRILASMKETPASSWTDPIIAATSTTPFNELHVSTSAKKILLPTGDSEYLVLIGYELDNTVQARISPKDLWAFLPYQKVSKDGEIARDPDTMCLKDPYAFDALFAWCFEVTPGTVGWANHDIKIRNAKFKTP